MLVWDLGKLEFLDRKSKQVVEEVLSTLLYFLNQ